MNNDIRFIAFVFVALNALALVVTSHSYTAWSIRTRNMLYYSILKKQGNLDRARNADDIADKHLLWIRITGFAIANIAGVAIALNVIHGR